MPLAKGGGNAPLNIQLRTCSSHLIGPPLDEGREKSGGLVTNARLKGAKKKSFIRFTLQP